ncbi:proline-rich protein 36 [Labeo rohita]|uniref:proline-rich protein 36 n=1 Tax=Labeo rohita TaxID=84645 RepID=UPI0021E2E097|nr:proline-rich protein 36 [Labeo rohita]
MLWAKGILLFTMAVTMLSSLRADPEAFSETGAISGAISKTTIHFGKLLIGGQGTASDSEIKTSDLMSTDSDEYQSNEEAQFRLAKAKLRRLGPSVHCSNDSMTLHIPGPRTPHFLVDRGDESPVPLSQMPASCGFSLKRARRDVSLVAPYQGCHVQQQGGSYILPLLIMGAPVQMSCPMSSRLPTVSCFSSGMTISLGVRADDVKIKVDGSWQPLLLTYSKCSFTLETTGGSLVVTAPFTGSCWEVKDTERHLPLMYGDREVTLSCPLTLPAPTTIAPTAAPTIPPTLPGYDPIGMPNMFYPFPFGRPWWQQPYFPGYPGVQPVPATQPPTTTTTTTTTPPPQDPVPQMFPHMHHMPMFDPYYFSPPGALAPQQPYPWYPMFPHMYGFQSPAEPTTAATTTTTPPTTTTAAQFEQQAAYPMFPMFYGSQPIKSYEPPAVKYPFMPSYPQYPVFGPRSPKSMSSPAQLSSIHRSRRHQLEVR